jgi:soluble lytic murein transglycosylase-like protein
MKGLISVESNWTPNAVGAAGEIGLGQLSYHEWSRFTSTPFRVEDNLHATAHVLGELYGKYGSWELTLAAYNGGEGALARYGGPPPYVRGYLSMVRAAGLAGRWRDECSAGWPTP